MQFLAPLWLALGAAAAVPLLLHLLRRRSGVRVPFPAARYLARAEQEHSSRVRLRNWLLLALRVLALGCVALAAARPFVGGALAAAGVGGRPPAALAVVLDNSASTGAVDGGRAVLDDLRARALGALARSRDGDRVWLVTADGAVRGGGPDAARAAARAAAPLGGRGDLPAAVARAVALAGAAGLGEGAVVVVTDGQATAWTRPARAGAVRVAVVAPGTPAPPDRAVLQATAEPARWSPAGEVRGQLSAPGAWQVTLVDAAGRPAASARGLADSPGASVRVTLRPDARGWLAGALAVPPDEWRASDVRHFAVLVGEPPVATADPSAGPFAAAALATLQASGRVRPAGAPGTQVAEPQAAARLPAVLIAPADGARLGAANQALARLGVPWRLDALVTAPARATFRSDAALPSDSAPTVAVARRWRLAPVGAAAADTLAVVGAQPWAVAGERYVLLASPLDPAWTEFPLRASFVPWLEAQLTRRLAGGGRIDRAAPGASVAAPAGADALEGPLLPERAAGDADAPRTRTPVTGGRATVPPRAGVYFWLRGPERVGVLVADPEPPELALARLGDAELPARVFADAPARRPAVRDGGAAADAVLDGAARRSAAGLFAAAALLALAAEGLAARPRPR